MINKNNLKQGDLFLVDFDPSVGHEYRGERPAVIIESDDQMAHNNLITVMPLTSNLDHKRENDILIKIDQQNKLKFDSLIKVHDIISFDYSRFINKIGVIDQEIVNKIKLYLVKHFDLTILRQKEKTSDADRTA